MIVHLYVMCRTILTLCMLVFRYAAFLRRLAVASNCSVMACNYSLAPEHPFPSGLCDCLTAIASVPYPFPKPFARPFPSRCPCYNHSRCSITSRRGSSFLQATVRVGTWRSPAACCCCTRSTRCRAVAASRRIPPCRCRLVSTLSCRVRLIASKSRRQLCSPPTQPPHQPCRVHIPSEPALFSPRC